jgi:4-amino-4-deoxy-L-arabinose transferase-like glycosyltransferase
VYQIVALFRRAMRRDTFCGVKNGLSGRRDGWAMSILGMALVLRLAWGLMQPATIDAANLPDQAEYLELAQHLRDEGRLYFFDDRFRQNVFAYRMPGYPMLVAWCDASPRAVRVVQAILDTLTVLAMGLLARDIAGTQAMRWTMGIVALNPLLIYFTGLILSETLFTALLAWAMLMLWRHRWLRGGALLALAVMVRPSAIGLGLALCVVAAIGLRRRQKIAAVAVPAVLTLLLLTWWGYRNYLLLGEWVWTTTNGGITLYDGFHPGATGASDQSFVREMPELSYTDELGRNRYLRQRAARFMSENPRRSAELTFIKAARTLSPVPLSRQYASPLTWAAGLGYSLPLMILVVWAVLVVRRMGSVKVYLLMPLIYFTAIHALSVGSLRYRIPAEPPMAILAALVLLRRSNADDSRTYH